MQKSRVKRLTIYTVMAVIFLIILVFMPKGGVGHPEIEAKLLITVLGIDKTEKGYFVSATAVMPDEGQNGTTKRLDIGAEGDSVSGALEEIMIKMGKPLELGLCGLVVVGDTFEGESVVEHFNYMIASGKVIPGAYLLFSPNKSAKETIENSNKLSEATANNLSELIEYNSKSNNVPTITVLDFLSETASKSRSSFMPCLIIEKSGESTTQGGGNSGAQAQSSNATSESEKTEIASISTVALFKEGVMRAIMNKDETRGFTWMDNKSTYGLVTLNNLKIEGSDIGKIHCQMTGKSFSLQTSPDGKTATVKIEAKLSHEDANKLNEAYRKYGLKGDEITKIVQKSYEEQITAEITSAFKVMKENDCDAIGVADNLYRFHFKEWKKLNGDEIFNDAEIKTEIKIVFV